METEDIDSDFRHIQLDDTGPFRSLQVDKLFLRAHQWRSLTSILGERGEGSSSQYRPPSPIRKRAVYPLPLPVASVESPLGGLFDYPEITPLVLSHFDHPRDFALLARVCKSWDLIVRKRLYENIWVRPWESGCHFKLVLLFRTLHQRPELCTLIKKLDVRFFPLAARGGERLDLDEQVREAVSKMSNLESLVWTRDKSMTPELADTLPTLPRLRSLEVSGHSYRYYDPMIIGRFPVLEDLRIMMPDSLWGENLVKMVRELDKRDKGGLRGLGLICRSSPIVDDKMLKDMSGSLTKLGRLTLWGCSRVTRDGVYHVLREAEGLKELSLDVSPHSILLDLSLAPDLLQLHTLSLSFPCPNKPNLDSTDLPSLPYLPRLESLHLTLSGEKRHLPSDGLTKLMNTLDFASIRRLSILGLYVSPTHLSTLLQASPELEELYISVSDRSTVLQCEELRGSGLKIIHVNAPERSGPTTDDLTRLAEVLPDLEQVGSGNRVYETFRSLDNTGRTVVELARWSRTTTPAYFLVWRG